MAAMYTLLLNNYKEIAAEAREHPLMDSWALMSSPWPTLGVVAAYLVFVLGLGPRLMAHRPAFHLKFHIAAYNAFQVVFSLWLATMPLFDGTLRDVMQHGCSPRDIAAVPTAVSSICWWYFLGKLLELLDTVFFVLRKKQSQVTFLHVYHHTSLAALSWAFLKHVFVPHGVVVVVVNSGVHVVMYSYYLLAAMGPSLAKYLWWKKYITWMQQAQFLVLLTYVTSLVVFDCKLPRAVTFVACVNLVIFLCLFARFYRKAYRKATPRDQSVAADEHKPTGAAVAADFNNDNGVTNVCHKKHTYYVDFIRGFDIFFKTKSA